MIGRTVTKRDGTSEPFDKVKVQRWAEYAARHNVDWEEVSAATLARLPSRISTEEIHETMISVCLDKEHIDYSRVAARLLYAQLRKSMSKIGASDRGSFLDLYTTYTDLGLWKGFAYTQIMEEQYRELFDTSLEYWQIKQWMDKYSLKVDGEAIETAHAGALAIGHAVHGNTKLAFDLAKAIIKGQINLPTPALNGIRNGDWNTISCSVMEGGDTIPSIGVADHLAYMMTAKKAGIGIKFVTRSIGNDVKGGAVKHLGKLPIYATVDKSVKMFTQVTRGRSATVSFSVYDPEVREIIMVKSQRTPENKRLDKLDYSMCYDNAFVEAVVKGTDIQTVSEDGTLGPVYPARSILKDFLTIRKETGRMYCFNLSEANNHTPFIDAVTQSNLCLEIAIVSKPFTGMQDLYSNDSEGEMGFCTLAAINVMNVTDDEYEALAYVAVRTLNELMGKVEMFAPSLKAKLLYRRSLGVGITGLAGMLAKRGLKYSDKEAIEEIAEKHYFYLLKASIAQAEIYGAVEGIKTNWLPIDTKKTAKEPTLDWESLRGKPRANSVLVAHMPTESSAVFSNATNGLYPIRRTVINKQSRKGSIQYIAPVEITETAWDIDNITLAKAYAAVQAYTDQSISADYYVGNGRVSMSDMMKEWVAQAKAGVKSMYYLNTNDYNGGSIQDTQDDGCESGACKL